MKVRITFTGTHSLLMHNSQMSDPLNEFAKELKTYSSKKKKTDEDHEMMGRIEFRGGLYIDPHVGPYIPGVNIHRTLVEGGRLNKLGKDVERGVVITTDKCPLLYAGPRDWESLWADKNFVDRRSVKNQAARVMRTRPIFQEWTVEAEAEVDPGVIRSIDGLQQIADQAGAMAGLGDYRPSSPHGGPFGRYTAVVEGL